MSEERAMAARVTQAQARHTRRLQLELAIDAPFSREASLAIDRAVAAEDAKRERALRRRASAVSERLVSCLNRRDRARLELPRAEPDRRCELEQRLEIHQAEQRRLEAELTRLDELLNV
jgi:hypothetical protein